MFAAEPRDLSLLWVVFYIAAAGNETTPGTFERLINTAGGAQESRFVGGSQLISIGMAKRLGKRVVLGSPVRKITQTSRGVRVESDKLTVTGKRVIVAMAPVSPRASTTSPSFRRSAASSPSAGRRAR